MASSYIRMNSMLLIGAMIVSSLIATCSANFYQDFDLTWGDHRVWSASFTFSRQSLRLWLPVQERVLIR